MTDGRLEDKPDIRLEMQFFVQSSAELLSLGSREISACSPVHKLVSFDGRKAGPQCEIAIMNFDARTKSLNYAPGQMSLKRIISLYGENAGVTLRSNAFPNSVHPSHTTSPR